jgi:chromosome condensin MukBEF ATPase and DNA-binding subunit MukB
MKKSIALTSLILLAGCGVPQKDVDALKAQLAQTQQELAAAKSQIVDLNARIAELQPLAKKALKLPVTLRQRPALMGGGLVFEIKNISSGVLPVKVKFTSASFGTTKTFDVVMNAGAVKEIGHAEGWAVSPGDVAEVSSAGFDPVKVKF